MPPPTPGRTPGKGKRPKEYVLYNDNPRERGTHSGRPMPTNVPLNEDGMEDPEEFFRSSPTTSPMASTSRRTTMGGASVAPSSVGQSRRLTKGRMSQLDGSDDDEMNLGYNALDDDDELGDNSYFGPSNPTTVPLPRRSELGPATPGTNVDDLPSPSVSRTKSTVKRKSALSRSPNQTLSRRSIATTVNQSPLGRDLDFDGDDMLLEDDTTTSPNSRRQSRKETIATDEAVPSPSMTNRNRQSTASRRSDVQEEDEDEGEGGDVEQPEQSYEFDNDLVNEGGGVGGYDEDVSAEEDEAEAEFGLDGDDNADDENGQEAEDEDTGEETAVERPAPKAKRTKADKVVKAKAKARPRAESRQRQGSSESSDTSPIKRARVSGFPLPGSDEDHEYKGDFKCRRSGRSHIAPLKWWIGEHVEYQPGRHLAEVREVVRKAEAARPSFAAQRKAGRKTSKPARSESVADPDIRDGTGFDAGCKQFAVVWDFPTNTQDDHRRIAMPYDKLAPAAVKGGAFEYQKVFGEEAFAAAGVIRIPPGSSKPGKSSKDNAFFFFVYKGGCNINVHRTSFNMGPGAMFMIPRGNKYSIENISDVQAELFFAQSRKAVMTDKEERLLAELNDASTSGARTPGAEGSGKKRKSIEPETDLRKKAIARSKKR